MFIDGGGILCINQYMRHECWSKKGLHVLAAQKVCFLVLGLAALIYTPHGTLYCFCNDAMCWKCSERNVLTLSVVSALLNIHLGFMFYFIVGLKALYLAVNIPISALIWHQFKTVSSKMLMKRYTIILNVKGKYNNTSIAMELNYYYYHHHHHHRISHFSALTGKYSPILGCINEQD